MKFKAFRLTTDASGLGFPEPVIEMRWEHNGIWIKQYIVPEANFKIMLYEARYLKKSLIKYLELQ